MKKQLLRLVALMTTLMLAVLPLAGLAEETDAVDKKETVFVLAGADGTPLDIVVSEKLHNADGAATLNDVSSLTDIENLSGDETFTAENGALVWDAQGNDIHYEGKSDAEVEAAVREAVNQINRTLPSFKHMTEVEIMKDEFEKTTTKKIKRFLYEKK